MRAQPLQAVDRVEGGVVGVEQVVRRVVDVEQHDGTTLRLRKLPGVNRPAIACLWPSRNPQGFNVVLDCGADIRADAPDLLQYAMMGASYARNGLGVERPRVGLLNVGTEEHKGRGELKLAHELIEGAAADGGFDYVGFVEGGDLMGDREVGREYALSQRDRLWAIDEGAQRRRARSGAGGAPAAAADRQRIELRRG